MLHEQARRAGTLVSIVLLVVTVTIAWLFVGSP
jgi:hypothetical protein